MKLICGVFTAALCAVSLSGCSSPYLPHNAVKYIPEFSQWDGHKPDTIDITVKEGGVTMKAEPLKQLQSYFSPNSIRERYAQHIQNEPIESGDPLYDVARDTVELMRLEGKSEDEIRKEIRDRFHFTDEVIDALMKK